MEETPAKALAGKRAAPEDSGRESSVRLGRCNGVVHRKATGRQMAIVRPQSDHSRTDIITTRLTLQSRLTDAPENRIKAKNLHGSPYRF